MLTKEFEITEEWSYVDRTTGMLRTLDMHAFRQLPVQKKRILPGLALLIECKKSALPYVFFKSASFPRYTRFPQINGVHPTVTITTPVNEMMRSHQVLPMTVALGLVEEPFVSQERMICATFSKVVREKDHYELSGSKPYHDLLLPLVSALQHAAGSSEKQSREVIRPVLCLALAVIDGPMVVYDTETRSQTAASCVRVVRHESERSNNAGRTTTAVDVVHIDYLDQYIDSHVIPFATEFASRISRAGTILFEGISHVERADWSWRDLVDAS